MVPIPDQSIELDAVNAAIAWMKAFEAMCVAHGELERSLAALPPAHTLPAMDNADLDEARARFELARPKLVAAVDLVCEFAEAVKPPETGRN